MIRLVESQFFKLKLRRASAHERAELMRNQFYFLGKNVELYTLSFGTEPYLISIHDNVICAHDVVTKAFLAAFKSAHWLKSLKDKVGEFKKKEVDQTAFLDDYLSTFDENSVYENDIITKIIRDNIKDYQKKYGKRVVLVIEDMDRLDPAHLFRIMNVFSAHMDYGYRSMQPIDSSLVGNKFGVSNVVFVMHEKNTEAIFHHFYGECADYDGYMSKFYNKDIFRFSLAEEKENYALALISEETGLGEERIKEYFDKGFLAAKTMLQIIYAMDKIEEQFYSIRVKEDIRPNPQILKLIYSQEIRC